MSIHDHDDGVVGQPLCPDCYDYLGHLVWQWWAPELWRRFTITLRRVLARHLGLSETASRELVRVQFAKVAEFQRRGLIHFHALIRLDGPPAPGDLFPAPAVDIDAETLAELVVRAAGLVGYDAAPIDGATWSGRCGSAPRSTSGPYTDRQILRTRRAESSTRRPSPRMSRSTPPKPPLTWLATSPAIRTFCG